MIPSETSQLSTTAVQTAPRPAKATPSEGFADVWVAAAQTDEGQTPQSLDTAILVNGPSDVDAEETNSSSDKTLTETTAVVLTDTEDVITGRVSPDNSEAEKFAVMADTKPASDEVLPVAGERSSGPHGVDKSYMIGAQAVGKPLQSGPIIASKPGAELALITHSANAENRAQIEIAGAVTTGAQNSVIELSSMVNLPLTKADAANTKNLVPILPLSLHENRFSKSTNLPSLDKNAASADRLSELRQSTDLTPKLASGQLIAPQGSVARQAAMVAGQALPTLGVDPLADPSLSGEAETLAPGNANVASTGRLAAPHSMQMHAPHVAQQLTAALTQSKTGVTEIALNPQELGRVRMALTAVETGVSVSIIAERPETADLMRRNIEILAREFRDIGYDSVSFSFEDQSGHSDDGSDVPDDNRPVAEHLPQEAGPITPQTTVIMRSGLDLKL